MASTAAFKYLWYLLIPASLMMAFGGTGIIAFLPLIIAFVLVPLLDIYLPASTSNLSEEEENNIINNKIYNIVLYSFIPVFYLIYSVFIITLSHSEQTLSDLIAHVTGMGVLMGLGINVSHELGHRRNKTSQSLAQLLLLPAGYLHFLIEHYYGHHVRVSTPSDPASARRGESVYQFWVRSIVLSYVSAWRIQRQRLQKRQQAFFSFHNAMLLYQVSQIVYFSSIFLAFGSKVFIACLIAAMVGVLLLESINYIEHYGLSRKVSSNGHFERVQPQHSWNSDHVVGRCMLFELSRHSDHHIDASRPYPILRHHTKSPQMPTGYPGMVLLSLIPPLWFRVMHPQLDRISRTAQ